MKIWVAHIPSLVNSTKHFKKQHANYVNLFQKTEEQRILPRSFCEVRGHYLDIKTHNKSTRKRKLNTKFSNKHGWINLQQSISKLNLTIYKRIMQYNKLGFILKMQGWLSIWKWTHIIYHINTPKKKNSMYQLGSSSDLGWAASNVCNQL